jgi:hypothetical protein
MTRSLAPADPRWSTSRDTSCPTLGPAVADIARRALGIELMPWQRRWANIVGEVLPSGRMRYPVVVMIVPRRAGKSLLVLAELLQRANATRGARCWYTAQTGGDAGKVLKDDWLPKIRPELRPSVVRPRLTNGSEALLLPRRDSLIGVFPPTREGLHSKDANVVVVDEAWSFGLERAAELNAAIKPAQSRIRDRQRFIISAGGDAASTWLLQLREQGRQLVDSGGCADAGVAFLEYSADPEHDDLSSPDVWARTHPAVGQPAGIDIESLQSDWNEAPGDDAFLRGYLSIFTETTAESVIPPDSWKANAADVAADGQLRVGYAVGLDGAWTAITVASKVGDQVVVELAKYGAGTSWAADELARLRVERRATLHAVGEGPTTVVTGQLLRRGIDVDVLTEGTYATACQAVLDDVLNGRLKHRGQPGLDIAVRGAARSLRLSGWVWAPRRSTTDISPLVALTAATQAARSQVDSGPIMRLAAG